MFNRRELDGVMEAIGFRRVAPLTYEVVTACEPVRWEARVEPTSSALAHVSVQIVFRHDAASSFAQQCLGAYGGPMWESRIHRYPMLLCGGIAPLCEFDPKFPLPGISHKQLSATQIASLIVDSLTSSVVPFVRSVSSEERYYEALSRGDAPLRWTYGQPLLRVAEIAFLGQRVGIAEEAMLMTLTEMAAMISPNLQHTSPDEFIASIIKDARGNGSVPNPSFQRTATPPLN